VVEEKKQTQGTRESFGRNPDNDKYGVNRMQTASEQAGIAGKSDQSVPTVSIGTYYYTLLYRIFQVFRERKLRFFSISCCFSPFFARKRRLAEARRRDFQHFFKQRRSL
jgi:hypothetical protein